MIDSPPVWCDVREGMTATVRVKFGTAVAENLEQCYVTNTKICFRRGEKQYSCSVLSYALERRIKLGTDTVVVCDIEGSLVT